jgi:hypothetical protein
MKLDLQALMAPLKRYYEIIVAAVGLSILIGSTILLTGRIAAAKLQQARLTSETLGLKPAHEEVSPVARDKVLTAIRGMDHPAQMTLTATNVFLVPEMRVTCIYCGKPIPFAAQVCPFPGCGKKQPDTGAPSEKDTDGDGIPDWWELKYGLNPNDADDASQDPDKDGYTNLEEYRAGSLGYRNTNPRDPNDSPPAWMFGKLTADKITSKESKLLFMISNRQPDGSQQFQINDQESGRTYWRKLGERILGYEITKYEPKVADVRTSAGMVSRDVSELTLRSAEGDELVETVLVKGVERRQSRSSAELVFAPDTKRFAVKPGTEFEIRGRKYRVKEIDAPAGKVIVVDDELKKEVPIGHSNSTN